MRARARQLHLSAHENARRDLVGSGGPDGHRLPLGTAPSHGLAHLGRDEAAHLLVLDLVDTQRGRGSLRSQQRHVGRASAGGGGFQRGQGAARGFLDLVGGRGRRGGEHRLSRGETQRGVGEDRIPARLEHGGAQLGGNNNTEDEENHQRGGRDGQCELSRQGVTDAVDELR